MAATDVVLTGMANELHEALTARGLDTKNPPTVTHPPAAAAFAEYKNRGGKVQVDPDAFAAALVAEVQSR